MSTFVLVHEAWQSAGTWNLLGPLLEKRGHRVIIPVLTEFDSLTALENWVEKGQAPEELITGRLNNGFVERTRPVFPYPVLARYSGKGDPKQADSFLPFDPSQH